MYPDVQIPTTMAWLMAFLVVLAAAWFFFSEFRMPPQLEWLFDGVLLRDVSWYQQLSGVAAWCLFVAWYFPGGEFYKRKHMTNWSPKKAYL